MSALITFRDAETKALRRNDAARNEKFPRTNHTASGTSERERARERDGNKPRARYIRGGRGFLVHPVYLARVLLCMCVWKRVSSSSAGTAHSVSRDVPPGTELTENFAARGESGPVLPATASSRVPHFRSFAEKHAAFPIRSLARARSPGINPSWRPRPGMLELRYPIEEAIHIERWPYGQKVAAVFPLDEFFSLFFFPFFTTGCTISGNPWNRNFSTGRVPDAFSSPSK